MGCVLAGILIFQFIGFVVSNGNINPIGQSSKLFYFLLLKFFLQKRLYHFDAVFYKAPNFCTKFDPLNDFC